RERRRRGVRVNNPEDAAVRDDGIGVPVEAQERREAADAFPDVAVEQNAGVLADLVREQQVDGAGADRESRSPEPGADGYAAGAPVRGAHVVVAGRVAELEVRRA